MKNIQQKALGAMLAALGLALVAPMAAHAAFVGLTRTTSTATAVVGGGQVAMSIQIKAVSNNAVAAAIGWSGVTAGQGWKVADHYIQLNSTLTVAGAGIQTYTDNTAGDAIPKYTGVISTSTKPGSGLVDTTDTTLNLSTAWSIKDVLGVPTAANPNNAADPNSFQWLFNKDRSDVNSPFFNSTAFADGDDFITVEKSGGPQIHFGQAPSEFGAAASPNFIYYQADFTNALGGRTYQTSTLRLEAFTE